MREELVAMLEKHAIDNGWSAMMCYIIEQDILRYRIVYKKDLRKVLARN